MDENLVPFKDNFYKECNTINFFLNLLTEIQSQIEFFEYICEKDFKLLKIYLCSFINYASGSTIPIILTIF